MGELVHYFPEGVRFSPLTATALLTGWIVDTKRFTFSTSSRTFRIAAELREAGADPVVIRELFTDSLDVMLYRARLLLNTELVYGRFAVAGCDEPQEGARIAASRAADTMLEISGAAASFALYPIAEGTGISARSAGSCECSPDHGKNGGGDDFTVARSPVERCYIEGARPGSWRVREQDEDQ